MHRRLALTLVAAPLLVVLAACQPGPRASRPRVAPLRVGEAILTRPTDPANVRVHMDAGMLIVLGMKPQGEYGVEIDDQELDFQQADIGGTLIVEAAQDTDAEVIIRPHGVN